MLSSYASLGARVVTLRKSQTQRSRSLVPRAAAQSAAGGDAASGGGGGGSSARPGSFRERVTFKVPGKQARPFARVTQSHLNSLLIVEGAEGFWREDGWISRDVADLPDGGTVALVFPEDPPLSTQVGNLQRANDNSTISKELQFGAFLRGLACAEAPGTPLIMLQTAPFTDADGQDYTQIDAGAVAPPLLFLGEFKTVLNEEAVEDVENKLKRIRKAVQHGRCPALAAAVEGVTKVKLFLGGDMVRPGLTVQQLAEQAALVGVTLVLPSGQALGLASEPAPAVLM